MRHIRPAGLGLFLLLTQAGISQSPQSAPTVPLVPTTKILAIGATKATLTPEQRALILPHEVPETVQLYLNGKIDQWWVRQDGKGVVFLMNVTSVEEARSLLEQLPLGKAKLMDFEYMPLGPLAPLRVLLNTPAK
jgi:hypothetical protein